MALQKITFLHRLTYSKNSEPKEKAEKTWSGWHKKRNLDQRDNTANHICLSA